MHRRGGQHELATGNASGCTGQSPSVGGNEHAAFLRREMHAVEHVAGGVGGGAPGDDSECGEGFLGQRRDPSLDDGACREVLCRHRQMIDGLYREAAARRGERQGDAVGVFSEGEVRGASLVATRRSLEGLGGDEETSGGERTDDGGDAGFQPVVEISDGQGESGVVDGGEHVSENRQGEAIEAEPREQLAGGGEGVDGDCEVHGMRSCL